MQRDLLMVFRDLAVQREAAGDDMDPTTQPTFEKKLSRKLVESEKRTQPSVRARTVVFTFS